MDGPPNTVCDAAQYALQLAVILLSAITVDNMTEVDASLGGFPDREAIYALIDSTAESGVASALPPYRGGRPIPRYDCSDWRRSPYGRSRGLRFSLRDTYLGLFLEALARSSSRGSIEIPSGYERLFSFPQATLEHGNPASPVRIACNQPPVIVGLNSQRAPKIGFRCFSSDQSRCFLPIQNQNELGMTVRVLSRFAPRF